MHKNILFALGVLLCAGCVSTGLKGKSAYDPTRDVSPIQSEEKFKTAVLQNKDVPFDSAMAMAAITHLIRGETPRISRLSIAPGLDLTEPGIPLENFDLVGLTILDRVEVETIKKKEWNTRTMAVLTFGAGPFRALVLAEAFCTVTSKEVYLAKASVRSLSPAQPRVAAWFVPKKSFLAAVASAGPLTAWDLMIVANSMAVRVSPRLPAARGEFLAVALVLDRLEPGDTVQGGLSSSPMPDKRWTTRATVNSGVGFPVAIVEVGCPLNVPSEELFMHVAWSPKDKTRTNGVDVPIGRFSTCGTVFNTGAGSTETGSGTLESGLRFLDPKNKSDARLIQSRLAELGFYSAAVDGIFGQGSRRALAQFKKSNGLQDNANWDLHTQRALFAGTGQ
ncbi:MAG: peptidoglycan-binding protein [Deltaproteobacteria bacterium]|nr:peptidoglycan-binding protein [Deltaproteobacteria bacterium]